VNIFVAYSHFSFDLCLCSSVHRIRIAVFIIFGFLSNLVVLLFLERTQFYDFKAIYDNLHRTITVPNYSYSLVVENCLAIDCYSNCNKCQQNSETVLQLNIIHWEMSHLDHVFDN